MIRIPPPANRTGVCSLLLIVGVLALAAAACGGDVPDIAAPESTTIIISTAPPVATRVLIPTIALIPTPGAPSQPLTLSSVRDTASGQTADIGGVKVTISRVAIADYYEYYGALSDAQKRSFDLFGEAKDAVTIGLIQMKVENGTAFKINIYPDQATVVVGSEQVDAAVFLSDKIGGEYFPGVVKEGKVLFFLKRTASASVTEVLYALDAPSASDTYRRLGPDLQMKFTVARR